ncbi:glycosyltransferase [Diplocloster modestus]|uniref:Glycosyltransferase n=1 Tax=Diplocloster modestus TaxID=2850322 RepID=A0ABS6K3W2_9FIRM|nr:glycosyltransferase [Diplocloster modestus]MBU9725175.1 glycosyltransferase [Diplocloster modestus]
MIDSNYSNKCMWQINSYNFASTGNIMIGISEVARARGWKVYTSCPAARTMYQHKLKDHIYIGSILSRSIHRLISNYTGIHGIGSYFATKRFLSKVERTKPKVIHLHNLHGSYIHLPLLFRFIKSHPDIQVVWTLHDCWAFTGNCPHFIMLDCEQWKTQCRQCAYEGYPKGRIDQTSKMYKFKKRWFTGCRNLTIVTPSKWLANLTKQSFLSEYPVTVIYNGINTEIFSPGYPDIRNKYGIEMSKFIILGVSFSWGYRKGLDVFLKLASLLPNEFQIILVGISEEQKSDLPGNMITIPKTNNLEELAAIYSSADVFLNPTREDNFPTVNLEALACGVPVLTFDTGGSPEAINQNTGMIVNENNLSEVLQSLKTHNFKKSDCITRGREFAAEKKYLEYINLYNDLLREKG